MTRKTVKTSDVTDAVKFFLATTIIYTTDDAGYVTRVDKPNERYKYTLPSGEQKELMVYNEVIPSGVLVINPFAEGQGLTTPSQSFLYRSLRVAAIARVETILLGAVRFLQAQKGIKFSDPIFDNLPPAKPLLDLVGGVTESGKSLLDEVNDKTFAEVRTFLQRKDIKDDLISIEYNKALGVSKLRCDILQNADFTETAELGKMRKCTFQVVKALMGNLLGAPTGELSSYTVKRPSREVPGKFYTWMSVLFNLYSKINDVLDVIDPEMVVNLATFSYHLDNFPAYHGNAAWQLQHNEAATGVKHHHTVATPVTSSVGAIPPTSPHIPQPMQMGMHQPMAQQSTMIGQQTMGGTVVPGPVRIDGTQAPPTTVPSGQYMQQQPMFQGGFNGQQYPGMYPQVQAPVGMIGAFPQQPQGMMPGMMPGMGYGMQQPAINPATGMAGGYGMPGMMPPAAYGVPGMPAGFRYG